MFSVRKWRVTWAAPKRLISFGLDFPPDTRPVFFWAVEWRGSFPLWFKKRREQ